MPPHKDEEVLAFAKYIRYGHLPTTADIFPECLDINIYQVTTMDSLKTALEAPPLGVARVA